MFIVSLHNTWPFAVFVSVYMFCGYFLQYKCSYDCSFLVKWDFISIYCASVKKHFLQSRLPLRDPIKIQSCFPCGKWLFSMVSSIFTFWPKLYFWFSFFFIFNWKCTSFRPKTIFQRRPSLTSAIRSNLSPTVTFVVKAVSKLRFLATAINVSIMSENALYMWTAGAKQTDSYCLLVSVQTKISPVLPQLLKCSLI